MGDIGWEGCPGVCERCCAVWLECGGWGVQKGVWEPWMCKRCCMHQVVHEEGTAGQKEVLCCLEMVHAVGVDGKGVWECLTSDDTCRE